MCVLVSRPYIFVATSSLDLDHKNIEPHTSCFITVCLLCWDHVRVFRFSLNLPQKNHFNHFNPWLEWDCLLEQKHSKFIWKIISKISGTQFPCMNVDTFGILMRALSCEHGTCTKYPMYSIFTYIYHKIKPNVGKYAIHGSYGYFLGF